MRSDRTIVYSVLAVAVLCAVLLFAFGGTR